MRRLNIATHPRLGDINVPKLRLVYSRHALYRAHLKGIRELETIEGNCVVETEENERGKVLKLVLRVSHDAVNDVVVVVVPRGGCLFVVTTWLNRKDDTHQTLRRERISA